MNVDLKIFGQKDHFKRISTLFIQPLKTELKMKENLLLIISIFGIQNDLFNPSTKDMFLLSGLLK